MSGNTVSMWLKTKLSFFKSDVELLKYEYFVRKMFISNLQSLNVHTQSLRRWYFIDASKAIQRAIVQPYCMGVSVACLWCLWILAAAHKFKTVAIKLTVLWVAVSKTYLEMKFFFVTDMQLYKSNTCILFGLFFL